MRPTQKNNRSRGRGGRKGGGGGGGGNVVNRVYDSAGPEGKVRGTPQQIIDKYLSLARDAQTSGDRVMSENFLQHAEHYQRILIQAAAMQEQSRREAADAATDFEGDGPEGGSIPGSGERRHQPQPRHETERESGGATERESESADEIGGMTMIDSGRGSDDLLVVPEDITQSQPRRNGDGRRRRNKQQSDDASGGEQQTATEAQPEG